MGWVGLLAAVWTVVWLGLLLVGEVRDLPTLRRVAKPLASSGFVALALAVGAMGGAYGRAILVALLASWIGDVCLLSRERRWFLGGLLAFLGAHVAYFVAFAVAGVDPRWVAGAVVPVGLASVMVGSRLIPRVEAALRRPVAAYIVVITVMVAGAAGAAGASGRWTVLVAAFAFFLSDLAVARERFVLSSPTNRLWGLPLYYGAQLLFAATAGGAP